MAYTPKKFTEWHFNSLLVPLFTLRNEKINREMKYRGQENYMLISQPWEINSYCNLELKPQSDKKDRENLVTFFRELGVSIDSFVMGFLPDAVLLSRSGRPYIFEVKMELREEKKCNNLVLQTLIYANSILSPSYDKKVLFSTYEFLDLLYRAHWFSQEYDGEYTCLEEKHADYFGYKTHKRIWKKKPRVIFALVNPRLYSLPRLINACKTIRKLNFVDYKKLSKKILPANSQFKKRIDELKNNWSVLQKIEFSVFPINLSVLESTIEERFTLFEEEQ